MVFMRGAVYEPPAPEFPYILVFFDADSDVRVIRVVDSREAGMALLEKMSKSFAHLGLAELNGDAQGTSSDETQHSSGVDHR